MNLKSDLASYRGKRVFVTGHTGFKGTWLVALLRELGAEIMGYALPPETTPNHFDLLAMEDQIQHITGDICDGKKLSDAMQSFKPEFVFHLAAQALVGRSYEDPVDTFNTNVMGSTNLLDAVRHCDSVSSLVYITSDKCYENVEWEWGYRENDRLGGHDPYSASKAAAELIFSAYFKSYFSKRENFGAASARAGNVIGGGDWSAKRIVPDCIRAISSDQPIQLRNPGSTRPWQHVLEPLSGYLQLGAALSRDPKTFQGGWNFGPSTTEVRNVEEVANAMIGHLGRGTVEIVKSPDQPHEATLLQLNCDRAHQLLGWHPRWSVDKTLAATAEWYRAHMTNENIEQTTISQLRDYFPELT